MTGTGAMMLMPGGIAASGARGGSMVAAGAGVGARMIPVAVPVAQGIQLVWSPAFTGGMAILGQTHCMMEGSPGGDYPRIVADKQGKHIPGHKNYIPGRSPLTHKDPQSLIDRFAGRGQPVGPVPRGQAGFKERVDFGEIIGASNGSPTTIKIIHYGKDGVHIVPAFPKR